MKFINEAKHIEREYVDRYIKINKGDELAVELLKPVPELAKTTWSFEIFGIKKPINDVAQIKVSVKDIGVVYGYFNKDLFTKEVKDELFGKLLTLKSIDTTQSVENLKHKITSLFKFLDEYHPFFAAVDFTNVTGDAEFIITSLGLLSYQIVLIKENLADMNIVIGGPAEAPKKEEKEGFFAKLFKKKDKQPKQEQPKAVEKPVEQKEVAPAPSFNDVVEEKPVTTEKKSFGTIMKGLGNNLNLNKVDYILNVLYSMLVAVCLFLCVVYFSIKKTGIGFLFVGFTSISFLLSTYNIFVFRRDKKTKGWWDYIIFFVISLIGVVVGLLIGFLISKVFVKPDSGSVKYLLPFVLGGIGSPLVLGIAQGAGYLITLLIGLIKKNKK